MCKESDDFDTYYFCGFAFIEKCVTLRILQKALHSIGNLHSCSCHFNIFSALLSCLPLSLAALYSTQSRSSLLTTYSLQYNACCAVNHLRNEHGSASAQAAICLLMFILLVLAVEIMTLTVETSAVVRHLACDAELLSHCTIKFFA